MAKYHSQYKQYIVSLHGTRGMFFVNDVKQGFHSPTVPTIIEMKAIFMRPGLHEFFTTISEFAVCVFIWNSMKRSIAEKIVQYLFRGLPLLFDILGHDSCQRLRPREASTLQ